MKHDFHVREQIHRQIWAAIMSQWPMGEAWIQREKPIDEYLANYKSLLTHCFLGVLRSRRDLDIPIIWTLLTGVLFPQETKQLENCISSSVSSGVPFSTQ
jgi:hypothetical protein